MDIVGTGQRIARARRRRGLSQAALAALVGRSESWLSQVERGQRTVDSHKVLTRLAAILRTDVSDLADPAEEAALSSYPLSERIEQAMAGYLAVGPAIAGDNMRPGQNLAYLRAAARAAYRDYQATRYEQAGHRLIGLIADSDAAGRGDRGSEALRLRAVVYDAVAALLSRVGDYTLAWTAADRALAAAQESGDPVLMAAAAWRLSYVLTGRGRPVLGADLAANAAAALARVKGTDEGARLSVTGALYLAAATAAAAAWDQPAVRSYLREADAMAGRLGRDANLMGTAFGPVNVAIHTMSTALRFGDARTAVDIGESLDGTALPRGLVGRQTQVYLDLARAYAIRRQDAAAVNTLIAAEKLSPQLVRYHGGTHSVITSLLRREHLPSTPDLRPLAQRAGVVI